MHTEYQIYDAIDRKETFILVCTLTAVRIDYSALILYLTYRMRRSSKLYGRTTPSFMPSRYSFPPFISITSLMWRDILSIQLRMRACVNSFQHLIQTFSAIIRVVGGPFRVVSLFIQIQHGSIMFKSGELPDQKRRRMPAFMNIFSWCLKAWLGALSSCTMVFGRSFIHSFANEINFERSMCFW